MKKILIPIGALMITGLVAAAFAASDSPFDELENHVQLMGKSFDEVATARPRMADKPTVMQQYRELPNDSAFKQISWHFKDGRLSHVGYTLYVKGQHINDLKSSLGKPDVEKTDSEIASVNYEWHIGERKIITSSTGSWLWLD